MNTKSYRPTFAEIDLGAIRHNLRKIKELVGEGVKITAIVKADAYGHGMREVSKAIVEEGVDYLGVASLDEARELRETGIKNKIIVLGAILPEEIKGVLRFDIIQTISDMRIPRLLSKLAMARNKQVKVHLKIDTGMGRIGFWHLKAVDFIKRIVSLKNILVEGIFTHFPSAEEDEGFTYKQIRDFNNLIGKLYRDNIDIPIKHSSNSMAIVGLRDSHMNMVRPGLIMYGLYPKKGLVQKLKLKTALKLKTKVVYLKPVSKGRSVSYGRTFVTKGKTKLATLPIGYGDGYSRYLSNRGYVLVRGERAPVVGRVCMDMTMVDVGHIKDVREGDEVVLIGRQGKEVITAEELAESIGTVPYEIVCNINRRIPRVYRS